MQEHPTVELTPEALREDAVSRVARSAAQFTVAGASVILGVWVVQQAGWDGEMPPDVRTATEILLATGAAYWTNRKRLRSRL